MKRYAARQLVPLSLTLSLGLSFGAPPAGAGEPPAPLPRPDEEEDAAFGRKLQAVLRSHGAEVHECYGVALAERPDASGEVLVRLWVAPGGAVSRVDILKDQVGSRRLTECLADAMRRWRAPELGGEAVQQVVFPLAFRPEAAGGSPAPAPASAARRHVVPQSDAKPGPLPGGKLDARVLIAEPTVGPTRASLTRLLLKPSARLAPHRHPGALELLYVVRGLARLRGTRPGVLATAQAGDVILVPAGSGHSIEAAPLAPLELLQFFVPAGPEQAYLDPSPAARAGTVPIDRKASTLAATTASAPEEPRVIQTAALKRYPAPDGKGSVTLLLDGSGTGAAALQRLEAEAGSGIPLHQHADADEIVYLVEGRGETTVDGERHPVAAGDAIHLPAGSPHAVTVHERIVAVQCYAPAGPEQRFKNPAGSPTAPASPGPRP